MMLWQFPSYFDESVDTDVALRVTWDLPISVGGRRYEGTDAYV